MATGVALLIAFIVVCVLIIVAVVAYTVYYQSQQLHQQSALAESDSCSVQILFMHYATLYFRFAMESVHKREELKEETMEKLMNLAADISIGLADINGNTAYVEPMKILFRKIILFDNQYLDAIVVNDTNRIDLLWPKISEAIEELAVAMHALKSFQVNAYNDQLLKEDPENYEARKLTAPSQLVVIEEFMSFYESLYDATRAYSDAFQYKITEIDSDAGSDSAASATSEDSAAQFVSSDYAKAVNIEDNAVKNLVTLAALLT